MNYLYRILLLSSISSIIGLVCCSDTSKNAMSNADNHLSSAVNDIKQASNSDLNAAKVKTSADWEKFKTDSSASIASMQSQVADLNTKMSKASQSAKVGMKVQLDTLSEKLKEQGDKLNRKTLEVESDMKKFDANVASRNESFEREFRRDMDELGTAIKNLFKDNVK